MTDTTVILVDEDDNFLGYEKKEACHTGDGKHHRAIAFFLFNKNGETLLQRRKHKRWDNVWDIAGATDVLHINGKDETYEESAARCLEKEWKISVPLKRLFGFNYFEKYGDMCENEYLMILAGEISKDVEHNPEVAYGCKWVSLENLAEDIVKNPNDYTPWAIIAVKELRKSRAMISD
ncbi:NUDIX domain-containing protein [Candidatus Woesearchaeota archaeon]|nr:NUDIX domain-containing protein [Candidatus Woesearchaeota archaeon]